MEPFLEVMRVPNDIDQSDDPAKLTPEARLREIAGLLARGVLRLRSRTAEISPRPDLDLSRETVLSVQSG